MLPLKRLWEDTNLLNLGTTVQSHMKKNGGFNLINFPWVEDRGLEHAKYAMINFITQMCALSCRTQTLPRYMIWEDMGLLGLVVRIMQTIITPRGGKGVPTTDGIAKRK